MVSDFVLNKTNQTQNMTGEKFDVFRFTNVNDIKFMENHIAHIENIHFEAFLRTDYSMPTELNRTLSVSNNTFR